MNDANKEIVRRLFDEVVHRGDFSAFDDLLSEDVVLYDPTEPEPVRGRDAYRAATELYLNAFPALQVRIDDQIAEGDRVATRWTATGRHEGELFGIPATGKDVELSGISIVRIKDGRIVEEWDYSDALGLMRQLGVAPETGA